MPSLPNFFKTPQGICLTKDTFENVRQVRHSRHCDFWIKNKILGYYIMLTDTDIWKLADRMAIPLVFCDFKDKLKEERLQYGKSYIINMENEFDEDGTPNKGSHYCAFQVNKYPEGLEAVYFDSYGQPPPQAVEKFCKCKLPHNDKDIQSLMNSACGWYCLAFIKFLHDKQNKNEAYKQFLRLFKGKTIENDDILYKYLTT
jgi:hypothetical protein